MEWAPISYQTSYSGKQICIEAFQSRARHSSVGRIAIDEGIPVRVPTTGGGLVCGSGKTEHDLNDFIYFAPTSHFYYWVFFQPPHIDISEEDASNWTTIARVDSALLGDVLSCRRAVFIQGDLTTPELDPGHGWRHLCAIGVRCREVNLASECSDRQHKRVNPISRSIGKFVFSTDATGRESCPMITNYRASQSQRSVAHLGRGLPDWVMTNRPTLEN